MRNLMMKSLFLKTIYDKRSFILGWSLGMTFIAYLMTIFYPTFQQDNTMDELMKSLPAAFQGLVGNLTDLKQLSTYLGSQLFEIRMPIFLSIMTIILALGLTVGEEDKGQLRTLLMSSMSRTRALAEKWFASVAITFFITCGALAGIGLGFAQIGESTSFDVVLRLLSLMWLLAVAMVSLVIGIGAATGHRGITNATAIVVMIGGFLVSTFAQSVEWLQSYEFLSIFSYYQAPDIAKGTVDTTNILVLVGIIFVSLFVGWFFFRRRDIN